MRVYDPIQGRYIPRGELFALSPLDGWSAVYETEGNGHWFALHEWSGETRRLEAVSARLCEYVAEFEAARYVSEAEAITEGTDWRDIAALLESPGALLTEGAEDRYACRAVFVLGGGASGKSAIAKSMFAGLGLKFINQDKHLERFFKELDIPLSQVGQRYDLQKKAQALKSKEFKHYSQHRNGLVVDMTGWAYDRVASPVQRLRALGYDVSLVTVYTSLRIAQVRNQQRERVVPPGFIADAHEGLWKNFPAYKKLFGASNVSVISNEDKLTPEEWAREFSPKLRVLALDMLGRPLKNTAGKRWIAAQKAVKISEPARVKITPQSLAQPTGSA
mgnify:FL=1